MTYIKELEEIKNNYKTNTVEQQFDAIKTLLSKVEDRLKWNKAVFIFSDTPVRLLVSAECVSQSFSEYINNSEYSFDYKVDLIHAMIFQFGNIDSFDDSIEVLKLIFSDHSNELVVKFANGKKD